MTGPGGQPRLSDREHVKPKAVNVLHCASAFGGATRCIASCETGCRKFAFLSRSQEKMCTSVPEKRLTVPFGNQRRYFLSRDRTSKKWDRTSKKRDRKGGTERVGQNVAYNCINYLPIDLQFLSFV